MNVTGIRDPGGMAMCDEFTFGLPLIFGPEFRSTVATKLLACCRDAPASSTCLAVSGMRQRALTSGTSSVVVASPKAGADQREQAPHGFICERVSWPFWFACNLERRDRIYRSRSAAWAARRGVDVAQRNWDSGPYRAGSGQNPAA